MMNLVARHEPLPRGRAMARESEPAGSVSYMRASCTTSDGTAFGGTCLYITTAHHKTKTTAAIAHPSTTDAMVPIRKPRK